MKRAIQADGANELGCVGEGEDAVSMELFGNRLGQCAKHPAREHEFSLDKSCGIAGVWCVREGQR